MLKYFTTVILSSLLLAGCSTVNPSKFPELKRMDNTRLEYESTECKGRKVHIFTHEQLIHVKSELFRLGYSANSCIDLVNNYRENENKSTFNLFGLWD